MGSDEKKSNIEDGLLTELENLAKDNGIKRLDSHYLKRYLIGHQYDVSSALRAVHNFESFVERRQRKWLNLKTSRLEEILHAQIIDVLEDDGVHEQKVVWIRVGNWEPQTFDADEILEVSGVLCELAYAKTQGIKHIDVIIDLNHFSLKHLYGLSPRFAKRMVFFIAECLPMTVLHVYVIRQPKIFCMVYSLFKPFLVERIRKMITICGNNFEFLLTNIGSKVLPPELGGQRKSLHGGRWLQILYNKATLQELKRSGYNFI